jgi:hypothetical protein
LHLVEYGEKCCQQSQMNFQPSSLSVRILAQKLFIFPQTLVYKLTIYLTLVYKLTIDLTMVYKLTIDLILVYKLTIDLTMVYKLTIDLILVYKQSIYSKK